MKKIKPIVEEYERESSKEETSCRCLCSGNNFNFSPKVSF